MKGIKVCFILLGQWPRTNPVSAKRQTSDQEDDNNDVKPLKRGNYYKIKANRKWIDNSF
jgi:hypothetical protein